LTISRRVFWHGQWALLRFIEGKLGSASAALAQLNSPIDASRATL
jgi:hypothetical protein